MEWRQPRSPKSSGGNGATCGPSSITSSSGRTAPFRTTDRRTPDQKEIERVRTEGHKADAARLAEVEQARRELATQTIETTETFWTALHQAGPEKFVQALKDHDAKDYARAVYKLLGGWLKEPTT